MIRGSKIIRIYATLGHSKPIPVRLIGRWKNRHLENFDTEISEAVIVLQQQT